MIIFSEMVPSSTSTYNTLICYDFIFEFGHELAYMRPATEKTVTGLGTPMVHYSFIFKLKDKPYILYGECKCNLSITS